MSIPDAKEKTRTVSVLYDPQTGKISHMHLTVVLEGGYEPSEIEIEAQARALLAKRGETHAHLDTLHVKSDQIKPFTAYDVDVTGKKLIERH